MAIIDKEIYKNIEKMLYNYNAMKELYKEMQEDIIFSGHKEKELVQESGYYSDPTSRAGIELAGLKDIEDWIKVIKKVCEKFEGNEKGLLLRMHYFDKWRAEKIQFHLHIERRTYYMWRNDIVLYTALVAQKYNLIDIEKETIKIIDI